MDLLPLARRSNGATRLPAMSPGAARSSATSPMAAAPVRRWPGAALPSSSLHWLMKKLGEEGPGQDVHASCLSMNQVEIKFLFYLYDAIPFLEDCFHEPPSTTQLKSYGKIGAMFQEVIPKLQCLFQY
uniref:Uncharacterized protein n=1 Tax=Oryza glaberrima TaxID=4538 RepID=I1QA13_ORYGL